MTLADRIALKVPEAAAAVGRQPWSLYENIRLGRLKAYRPSPKSDYLILPEDLRAWVMGLPPASAGNGNAAA